MRVRVRVRSTFFIWCGCGCGVNWILGAVAVLLRCGCGNRTQSAGAGAVHRTSGYGKKTRFQENLEMEKYFILIKLSESRSQSYYVKGDQCVNWFGLCEKLGETVPTNYQLLIWFHIYCVNLFMPYSNGSYFD